MKRILPVIFLLLIIYSSHVYAACRFTTTAGTLAFGNLNPGAPVDVNITAALTFRCAGGGPGTMWAYTITDDDGLYETGVDGNRMVNTITPTQYLPYTFTYSPTAGSVPRNTNQTLSLNGTIKGIDYQYAYGGTYTDTIVLTILP